MVTQKLAHDPEVNDDPVGFHAQQAVEKALKVALTLRGRFACRDGKRRQADSLGCRVQV